MAFFVSSQDINIKEEIMNHFNHIWNDIENRLKDITNQKAYYVGGTLCLDLPKFGIGMNLNGKGFIYGGSKRNNDRIYLPKTITSLVQKIYLDIKGKTEMASC
jgi:hypothetical protein